MGTGYVENRIAGKCYGVCTIKLIEFCGFRLACALESWKKHEAHFRLLFFLCFFFGFLMVFSICLAIFDLKIENTFAAFSFTFPIHSSSSPPLTTSFFSAPFFAIAIAHFPQSLPFLLLSSTDSRFIVSNRFISLIFQCAFLCTVLKWIITLLSGWMVSVVVISRRTRIVYDFIELSFQYRPNSTHLWHRLEYVASWICVFRGHNSPTAINCTEWFFGGKQLNSQPSIRHALQSIYALICLCSTPIWPASVSTFSKQIIIHKPNLCLTRTKLI